MKYKKNMPLISQVLHLITLVFSLDFSLSSDEETWPILSDSLEAAKSGSGVLVCPSFPAVCGIQRKDQYNIGMSFFPIHSSPSPKFYQPNVTRSMSEGSERNAKLGEITPKLRRLVQEDGRMLVGVTKSLSIKRKL